MGVKIFQGADLEATATKLSCSKTYSISVRALDMISNRSPRDLKSATTPDCPSNPTDLLVSDITKTTATLSWSDAGGTGTGFDTYLDAVHRASVDSTSYTYIGLKRGTTHVLGVASHDAAGHIRHTCTCPPPWRRANRSSSSSASASPGLLIAGRGCCPGRLVRGGLRVRGTPAPW